MDPQKDPEGFNQSLEKIKLIDNTLLDFEVLLSYSSQTNGTELTCIQ